MPTLQLDRKYFPISDQMYRWTQQNAPDTTWDQMFGITQLIFTTDEKMEAFKKWLKRQ